MSLSDDLSFSFSFSSPLHWAGGVHRLRQAKEDVETSYREYMRLHE